MELKWRKKPLTVDSQHQQFVCYLYVLEITRCTMQSKNGETVGHRLNSVSSHLLLGLFQTVSVANIRSQSTILVYLCGLFSSNVISLCLCSVSPVLFCGYVLCDTWPLWWLQKCSAIAFSLCNKNHCTNCFKIVSISFLLDWIDCMCLAGFLFFIFGPNCVRAATQRMLALAVSGMIWSIAHVV